MQTGFNFQDETGNTKDQSSSLDLSTIFNSVFKVELATTPEAINKVFEIRYQVYCIDRHFEDPDAFVDKREHDGYDPRSAHALLQHRTTGYNAAAVRLVMTGDTPEENDLPMEGPCLHRMNERARNAIASVPRDQIAEISRMAVCREFRRRLNEGRFTSGISEAACYSDSRNGKRALPHMSLGLFAAILQMSVKHGITHWMAVMEPAQLRLLKRFGVEFDHVGPVLEHHGLRRPAFTEAASLVEGIRQRRPDVWSLITDGGRYLPEKPDIGQRA